MPTRTACPWCEAFLWADFCRYFHHTFWVGCTFISNSTPSSAIRVALISDRKTLTFCSSVKRRWDRDKRRIAWMRSALSFSFVDRADRFDNAVSISASAVIRELALSAKSCSAIFLPETRYRKHG